MTLAERDLITCIFGPESFDSARSAHALREAGDVIGSLHLPETRLCTPVVPSANSSGSRDQASFPA